MTVTARRLAWLGSFTPSARHHLGLAAMETALLLAWALLLDSIFRFATSAFLNILPLTYLAAANILAWLEDPTVFRMADPMTAKGLAEVDSNGRIPPRWRTLLRLLVTPPSFLLLLAGFLPVLRGRRSLPEVAAGVRIVLLDPSLDPKPIEKIMERQRNNRRMVLGYTFLSLSIAALIVLLPIGRERVARRAAATAYPAMSEEDRNLLSLYLDMTTRFPDSLEFHVRLASLYYRNGMLEDVSTELEVVERLDASNPILLLRQDLPTDPDSLTAPGEGFPAISELGFGPPGDLEADSLGADSTSADSAAADNPAATAESAPAPAPAQADPAPDGGAPPATAEPESASSGAPPGQREDQPAPPL